MSPSGAMPDRPMLDGIRVLELGQIISGTFAGMLMADMGADVIKIEAPGGDLGRNPDIATVGDESAVFLAFNRSKRSVVLDLKTDAGRDAFYRLARSAQVVIDNFRPGVLERLRIDYTTLSELNPRIVACSITGFGSASPRRSMPSFDLIHQAMSGMLSVTGSRDGPPARLGIPLADLAAPMFALHGILAALIAAERTGRGRRIEVSMLEALTFLHTYDGLITLNGGRTPHAWGTEHAHLVPWQAFATQDGHVAIAPREERLWRSLCIALQLPHLADDPRFATNADRVANRDLLIPILARQIGQRTTAEWLQAMAAHEVPAAPVNDLEQALAEATLAGEDAIVEVALPSFGRLRMLANPVRVAGTAAGYLPPPQLGEDTDAVLREVVGARQARATADVGRTGARLAGDRR